MEYLHSPPILAQSHHGKATWVQTLHFAWVSLFIGRGPRTWTPRSRGPEDIPSGQDLAWSTAQKILPGDGMGCVHSSSPFLTSLEEGRASSGRGKDLSKARMTYWEGLSGSQGRDEEKGWTVEPPAASGRAAVRRIPALCHFLQWDVGQMAQQPWAMVSFAIKWS